MFRSNTITRDEFHEIIRRVHERVDNLGRHALEQLQTISTQIDSLADAAKPKDAVMTFGHRGPGADAPRSPSVMTWEQYQKNKQEQPSADAVTAQASQALATVPRDSKDSITYAEKLLHSMRRPLSLPPMSTNIVSYSTAKAPNPHGSLERDDAATAGTAKPLPLPAPAPAVPPAPAADPRDKPRGRQPSRDRELQQEEMVQKKHSLQSGSIGQQIVDLTTDVESLKTNRHFVMQRIQNLEEDNKENIETQNTLSAQASSITDKVESLGNILQEKVEQLDVRATDFDLRMQALESIAERPPASRPDPCAQYQSEMAMGMRDMSSCTQTKVAT